MGKLAKLKIIPYLYIIIHSKTNFIMANFQDEFTVHGTHCLNNWGGIELELSRCGDGCRYRFNFGSDNPMEVFEAEIIEFDNPDWDGTDDDDNHQLSGFKHTTKNGDVEIYYLQDFMRV